MRHSKINRLLAVAALMGLGAHGPGQASPGLSLASPPVGSQIGHAPPEREVTKNPSTPLKKDEADCDECVIVKAPIQAEEPGGTLARTLWGLFWVLGPGRRHAKPQDTSPASAV